MSGTVIMAADADSVNIGMGEGVVTGVVVDGVSPDAVDVGTGEDEGSVADDGSVEVFVADEGPVEAEAGDGAIGDVAGTTSIEVTAAGCPLSSVHCVEIVPTQVGPPVDVSRSRSMENVVALIATDPGAVKVNGAMVPEASTVVEPVVDTGDRGALSATLTVVCACGPVPVTVAVPAPRTVAALVAATRSGICDGELTVAVIGIGGVFTPTAIEDGTSLQPMTTLIGCVPITGKLQEYVSVRLPEPAFPAVAAEAAAPPIMRYPAASIPMAAAPAPAWAMCLDWRRTVRIAVLFNMTP